MRPAVAGAVRLRSRWPLPVGPAVAVLGWHRIDVEGGALAVAPRVFARQMAALDESRQQVLVVHLDQVAAIFAARQFRDRRVVLTFDDAWADNHAHALRSPQPSSPARHPLRSPAICLARRVI